MVKVVCCAKHPIPAQDIRRALCINITAVRSADSGVGIQNVVESESDLKLVLQEIPLDRRIPIDCRGAGRESGGSPLPVVDQVRVDGDILDQKKPKSGGVVLRPIINGRTGVDTAYLIEIVVIRGKLRRVFIRPILVQGDATSAVIGSVTALVYVYEVYCAAIATGTVNPYIDVPDFLIREYIQAHRVASVNIHRLTYLSTQAVGRCFCADGTTRQEQASRNVESPGLEPVEFPVEILVKGRSQVRVTQCHVEWVGIIRHSL